MNSDSTVIDVESRVVSHTTDEDPFTAAPRPTQPVAAAAPPPPEVSELNLVPAIVAQQEIVKANPAITLMNALIARIKAELPTIDITTTKGEERARKLRAECVRLRTSTEDAYKAWNKPVLEAQRGIRAVVQQVAEGIEPSETQLDEMIKNKEKAAAEKKRLEAEAEEKRINALRDKITNTFVNVPVAAVKMAAAEIDEKIRELQDLPITDDADSFGEFSDEAEGLRVRIIGELLEMSNAKRAQEDEAARLEQQRQQQLEAERLAGIERGLRSKIDALKAKAFEAMGKRAAEMRKVRDAVAEMAPTPVEFGDLYAEAAAVHAQAVQTLNAMIDTQAAFERQQDEQRAQAEELQRQADARAAEERRQREAREAEEKAARERAERIESRINNLRNMADATGMGPASIEARISAVQAQEFDADGYGDRLEEAQKLQFTVLESLREALEMRRADIAAEERRQAEAAERERILAAEIEERAARELDSEAANFDEIADNVIQILMEADYPCEMGDRKLVAILLTNSRVQAALIEIAQGRRA